MTLDMKIVPLGRKANYLEARKLVAARSMKLVSNVLLDDYKAKTGRWNEEIYPAWAREMLVHPEKGGKFKKGKDVVDAGDKIGSTTFPMTPWIVPGAYLTDPRFVKADVFRKGVGLFIDPENVIEEKGRIVVIPASIVVLYPFIQEHGPGDLGSGKVDEATRIPLADKPQTRDRGGHLFRIDGVGVRPLAHDLFEGYGWRGVGSCFRPELEFKVSGEATEGGSLFRINPQDLFGQPK